MAYGIWSDKRDKVFVSTELLTVSLQPGSDGIGLADNRERVRHLGGYLAESLFPKILVPVDFSLCSEEAFRVALTLARTFQAELLLMHVIDTSALATFN